MDKQILKRYFIAGPQDFAGLTLAQSEQRIKNIITSGITAYQFRDKGAIYADDNERLRFAQTLREFAAQAGVSFIVNDDVQLTKDVNADGVHLGQADVQLELAREFLPQNVFIGLSVRNAVEMQKAQSSQADYLGVGPIFKTQSKADAAPELGLAQLTEILTQNSLPTVGIGGISLENQATLKTTGLDGIAMISLLTQTVNLAATMQLIKQSW